jgi:hypothetical protein
MLPAIKAVVENDGARKGEWRIENVEWRMKDASCLALSILNSSFSILARTSDNHKLYAARQLHNRQI